MIKFSFSFLKCLIIKLIIYYFLVYLKIDIIYEKLTEKNKKLLNQILND